MNTAHIHLILNHLPLVGMLFSMALLLFSFVKKSDELRRTAFAFFVGVACLAVPAYLTGEGAEEVVEHMSGVTEHAIEEHEEVAEVALIVTIVTGVAALVGLFYTAFSQLIAVALLILSLLSFGILGYTAKVGGEIRHAEIRGDFQQTAGEMNESSEALGKSEDNDDDD